MRTIRTDPPVSEAQRRLMHAAAGKKGGVGGVSQAVGKEFAEADPGGELPEHKSDRLDAALAALDDCAGRFDRMTAARRK